MNGAVVSNCDAFTLTVSSSHFRSPALSLSLCPWLDAAPPHGCASLHGAVRRTQGSRRHAGSYLQKCCLLIYLFIVKWALRSEDATRSSVPVPGRWGCGCCLERLVPEFWCWSLSHFFPPTKLTVPVQKKKKTQNCKLWVLTAGLL